MRDQLVKSSNWVLGLQVKMFTNVLEKEKGVNIRHTVGTYLV